MRSADRPDSARHQPHWLVLIVVSALAGAVVAALVTTDTISNAWDLASRTVDPPSTKEKAVDDYLDATRNYTGWEEQATFVPEARETFLRHFKSLDSSIDHPPPETWRVAPAQIQDVVQAPVVFGQRPITVVGRIEDSNVIDAGVERTQRRRLVDERLLLSPWPAIAQRGDPALACRVTRPWAAGILPRGAVVVVRGLVLAGGAFSDFRGGFTNGAYMACGSAVAVATAGVQSRSRTARVVDEGRQFVEFILRQIEPEFADLRLVDESPDPRETSRLERLLQISNNTICDTAMAIAPFVLADPSRRRVCRAGEYIGVEPPYPPRREASLYLMRDPFAFAIRPEPARRTE